MKTTLELPDDLFRQAKLAAVGQGQTFKRFVADALEAKLSPMKDRTFKQPWMKLAGAFAQTAESRKESDRIQKLIDEEFGQVDPEDWK
jgi:hypothetical protein